MCVEINIVCNLALVFVVSNESGDVFVCYSDGL